MPIIIKKKNIVEKKQTISIKRNIIQFKKKRIFTVNNLIQNNIKLNDVVEPHTYQINKPKGMVGVNRNKPKGIIVINRNKPKKIEISNSYKISTDIQIQQDRINILVYMYELNNYIYPDNKYDDNLVYTDYKINLHNI
jgi:hypothetical protein